MTFQDLYLLVVLHNQVRLQNRTTSISIKNLSSEQETYHTRVEFLTIDGVSKDASKEWCDASITIID